MGLIELLLGHGVVFLLIFANSLTFLVGAV